MDGEGRARRMQQLLRRAHHGGDGEGSRHGVGAILAGEDRAALGRSGPGIVGQSRAAVGLTVRLRRGGGVATSCGPNGVVADPNGWFEDPLDLVGRSCASCT